MLKLTRIKGFTIVELMIALVINAIIFTGLISIFGNNLLHYNSTISADRFHQQLETAMQFMTDNIRRAGYWSNAASNIGTNTNTNPFMSASAGTDITIGGSNSSCILFTYDHAKTGSLPALSTTSDDDRYGYRLINNTLQARPWGAAFSCSAASTAWENMLDPSITVTALSFTETTETVTIGPAAQALTMRSINISLTASLSSDSTVTETLTQHIRVRNDYFTP